MVPGHKIFRVRRHSSRRPDKRPTEVAEENDDMLLVRNIV